MTTGLNTVLANLNSAIRGIEGATEEGLFAAGLFIQGESVEMTPVQDSVLRNSAFTRSSGPMRVTIGYTAEYAAFVHEAPMKLLGQQRPPRNGTPQGPYWQGGENKFLEKAIKNNKAEILQIIRNRAVI